MSRRFVFETESSEVINQIRDWQINDPEKKIKPKIILFSEYEKEHFEKQLLNIKEALEIFNKNKISMDILIAYIKSKGIPTCTAKAIIGMEEDFFKKLGVM